MEHTWRRPAESVSSTPREGVYTDDMFSSSPLHVKLSCEDNACDWRSNSACVYLIYLRKALLIDAIQLNIYTHMYEFE